VVIEFRPEQIDSELPRFCIVHEGRRLADQSIGYREQRDRAVALDRALGLPVVEVAWDGSGPRSTSRPPWGEARDPRRAGRRPFRSSRRPWDDAPRAGRRPRVGRPGCDGAMRAVRPEHPR
jgi:hypothetical protein